MEFTGIVKKILPLKTGVSKMGNQWRILEAVIEEEGRQYPESIVVTQMNEVIDQQRLIEGRKVKVYISASAQAYEDRFFQRLICWKVENLDVRQPEWKSVEGYPLTSESSLSSDPASVQSSAFPPAVNETGEPYSNDLPF